MRKKTDRIIRVGIGLCLVSLLVFSLAYTFGSTLRGEKSSSGSSEQSSSERGSSEQVKTSPHPSFLSETELCKILADSQERITREEQSALEKNFGIDRTIFAGVVPHHLVAGSLIIDFLKALAPQKPELLIIVGPNHYNLGGKIITGFADWQTPEGLVLTEDKIVQILLEERVAVQDEQVLRNEHAIGNLIPLIKHYLPGAKVVPIILHHDVTLAEVDKLLGVLEPIMAEKNSVLLASVDFSHYLTRKVAEEKDRVTLEVMTNFDYVTLFHLGNDHLDSPASLATVFRYAEKKDVRDFRLLANTNSGVILQNEFIETTSYFTLLFLKE